VRQGRARAFDALTDFDRIGEHALDTIDPGDQVARSGWVPDDRSVSIYWLVVTALPSMTRQAVGAVDVTSIEPKQMLTGLPRGRMFDPYLARQLSDGEICTTHGGC
jgi:hypothetical protein